MIAAVFTVSCSNSSSDAKDSTDSISQKTEETTAAELVPVLPNEKYDGYTVKMLMLEVYNDHFKLNMESDGDALNDAGYKRNLAVSELLDVNFEAVENPDLVKIFKTGIMAGDDVCEFIFPHATVGVASMVTDRLLYDWNSMSYVDMTMPWWNNTMSSALSLGGHLYYASGDIVLMWQGMNAILFNKSYPETAEKDLYEIAFDGKWTMDTLSSSIKNVTEDLDGDGQFTKADKYGYLDHIAGGGAYLYCAGITITEQDDNGYPTLAMNTERTVNLVQKFYDLIYSGDVFLDTYDSIRYSTSTYRQMLLESRSFLTCLDIGSMYPYLREIEFDFGILPLPKYDENQENYRVFCGAGLIGVPSNITDPERTSVIAEAMAYQSYKLLRPALFDIVLENKAVCDENSYKILQMMQENKVWDFGFNFDSSGIGYGMITNVVINNKSTDFVSYYTKNESKLQKALQQVIDAFNENE
ncbi:MAG: hypothetical protein ACYCWE_21605 [Eubacteriales bacterium]